MAHSARPRGPGVLYSALALVLLIVLSVVSLTTLQPPPPTIAEFAPQALEQIEEAPEEQTSDFGTGEGGAGVPGDEPGSVEAAPTDPPIDIPRIRRCIGDPPRQIEDPQSPPCVPYWDGDNGGATSMGVTRDEIRVALPDNGVQREYRLLQNFFNSRFEFYGRKIILEPSHPTSGSSVAEMHADAANVREMEAFASLNYAADLYGGQTAYYDALARHKVIGVDVRPMWAGERRLAANAPYQWNYLPGSDDVGNTLLGEWMCKQLVGDPPEYAGPGTAPSAINDGPRVFGLVTTTVEQIGADPTVLRDRLQSCGGGFAREAELNEQFDAESAQTVVLQMQASDVTSIVCTCHSGPLSTLMIAATNQGYFPEWVVNSFMYMDQDVAGQLSPGQQRIRLFGQTVRQKSVAPPDMPSTWAIREADPSYTPSMAGTDLDYYTIAYYQYPGMLLLASGIQMAGPNLTPFTFEQGLHRTQFPNPDADGPPHFQAHVGFAGDHTMVNTAAVIWWSDNESSYATNGARGTYCYAELGRRYGVGTWPDEQQTLFEPPCR